MQTLTKLVVTLGGLLLPCLVAAQAPTYAVSGPALGLVADRAAGSIRPILGIPGAAMWGAPLSVDFATVQTAVAPGGDFALVVAKENFRVASVRAADGAVQWLALEGTDGAPDIVAFSPRGRAAALYYQASQRLVVLSGLRNGTAQVTEAGTAALPAAVSLLAVSEDGSSLLAAVPEGDSAAVYYLTAAPASPQSRLSVTLTNDEPSTPAELPAGASARRLTVFGAVSALEFVGESLDALVADTGANAVYLMRDASGAADTVLLGSARDGLAKPVSVKALDSRRVLVANAGTDSITILYRDGATPVSLPCGCTLAGLHPLSGGAVFRLTEPSGDPLLLLDAGGLEPRIVAVPPDRSPSAPVAAPEGGAQ
jgi:hypothetical protein